ncbi:hypothetical protein [Vibrio harveyi]|uniref:hypothetical protein n=1 Tax=Vibrio harveyi TaxID=669 RepID=UPI003CFB7DCA
MFKEVKKSRVSVAVQSVLFSKLNWSWHSEPVGSPRLYAGSCEWSSNLKTNANNSGVLIISDDIASTKSDKYIGDYVDVERLVQRRKLSQIFFGSNKEQSCKTECFGVVGAKRK